MHSRSNHLLVLRSAPVMNDTFRLIHSTACSSVTKAFKAFSMFVSKKSSAARNFALVSSELIDLLNSSTFSLFHFIFVMVCLCVGWISFSGVFCLFPSNAELYGHMAWFNPATDFEIHISFGNEVSRKNKIVNHTVSLLGYKSKLSFSLFWGDVPHLCSASCLCGGFTSLVGPH